MQKIFKIDLCVSSKLYDLVASTAKITLQEMGYKGLSSLSREIYYSFKIRASDRNEAEQIIKTMVRKTSFFVNPNKDIWRIGIKRDKEVISCLIFYLETRIERIREGLKNQGFNMVLDVSQGEVWHFSLLVPKEKGIALVKEMVELKSISCGLLANLHSQGYRILK